MIMERQLQPVIIFSFSRQNCEALALDMSKLDFNSGEQQASLFLSLVSSLLPIYLLYSLLPFFRPQSFNFSSFLPQPKKRPW